MQLLALYMRFSLIVCSRNCLVMLRILSLLFLSAGFSVVLQAQQQTVQHLYAITLDGKPAGEMITVYEQKAKTQNFSLDYTIKGSMIISYSLQVVIKNSFTNGILTYASAKRKLNSLVRDDNEVTRTANGYLFREKKEKRNAAKLIDYTIARLYFQEPPAQLREVFSEIYLEHLPVKRTGTNTLRTDTHSGGYLIYTYRNGWLYKLQANTSHGEAVFTLVR